MQILSVTILKYNHEAHFCWLEVTIINNNNSVLRLHGQTSLQLEQLVDEPKCFLIKSSQASDSMSISRSQLSTIPAEFLTTTNEEA